MQIELDWNRGGKRDFIIGVSYADIIRRKKEYVKRHHETPDRMTILYEPSWAIQGMNIEFKPSIQRVLQFNAHDILKYFRGD